MIAAVLWVATVVTAMAFIVRYTLTPGPVASAPIHWPANSLIVLDAKRPTLIMFAHPQCPCTRASIGELERLMANCHGRLSAQVWFIKPAATAEGWMDTDLWRSASAIPGVTVHCDEEGAEARRFQAETSGQTVLYDRNGRLWFQGGITISRGHSGDNPGRSAVEALLKYQSAVLAQTPVFGCPLFGVCANQSQTGGVACKQ